MVIAPGGERPRSRRELLGAAGVIAGSAAVLLSGCGGSRSSRAQLRKLPPAARTADVEIINHVLDLEYAGIAAYTAGIPLLTGAAAPAAKRFLNQELSHAGELSGLVKEAGGKPHMQKPSYDLGHPGRPVEVLRLLHAIESAVVGAYLDAIPRLSPGPVRASVASILANDAQHVSILRVALGRPPMPSPFVTGRE